MCVGLSKCASPASRCSRLTGPPGHVLPPPHAAAAAASPAAHMASRYVCGQLPCPAVVRMQQLNQHAWVKCDTKAMALGVVWWFMRKCAWTPKHRSEARERQAATSLSAVGRCYVSYAREAPPAHLLLVLCAVEGHRCEEAAQLLAPTSPTCRCLSATAESPLPARVRTTPSRNHLVTITVTGTPITWEV